jgi:dTDP-4-dehydrorhamnose reductase
MPKVVILGGDGQLARAIMRVAHDAASEYVALGRAEVDLCDVESLCRAVAMADIVVNCAAYTNVEAAEDDTEGARAVNVRGVQLLAVLCAKLDKRLIHISTDYVFGGDTNRNIPYVESDPVAPINNYGCSKAEGERAVLESGNGVVIRTSWLYSPWGKNFCRTILSLSASQPELRVVDDQRGVPTSALSLARYIVGIVENDYISQMSGIYHYTDIGDATWYDFASEIVALAGNECRVVPCSSAERVTRAKRPQYSVLGSERLEFLSGLPKPWREALIEVMEIIKNEL